MSQLFFTNTLQRQQRKDSYCTNTPTHTCDTKSKKKKEGRSAQTFAVESERARRDGRHDLAVYPQCLPQNFDAMARSQAEKFPKTCRQVFHVSCEPGPKDLCTHPLIDRKSVCRAPQTLCSQHCGGANMPDHTFDASVLAITGFPPLHIAISHLSSSTISNGRSSAQKLKMTSNMYPLMRRSMLFCTVLTKHTSTI